MTRSPYARFVTLLGCLAPGALVTACAGASPSTGPPTSGEAGATTPPPASTDAGEEPPVDRDGATSPGTEPDATFSGVDGDVGRDASSAPDAAATAHPDGGARDASVREAGVAADGSSPVDGASGVATGCGGVVLGTGPLGMTATHLDVGVHDPSMIWDGHLYYLFATGGTLAVRSSPDLLTWTNAGEIFTSVPSWVTSALGSNPGSLWAPDISYFGGSFHVYYAGSTFGSNDSVIGLATTPSLSAPRWTDQGLVVQSTTSDDFNAIDPNVAFDATCQPWLAYGSFWSGIKLRKLDASTGKPATDDTTAHALASRNGGAIEAASIVAHDGFYDLFVSFDACCKGVQSTYRTMVGRARSITGPYTDKAGVDMNQGAAEELLATSGRYIGPGGGTAWRDGDAYLYAFHYYDGQDNGASKLQVRPISFDAGDWVALGDPLFP